MHVVVIACSEVDCDTPLMVGFSRSGACFAAVSADAALMFSAPVCRNDAETWIALAVFFNEINDACGELTAQVFD